MNLPAYIAKLDPVASFERCRLDITKLKMTKTDAEEITVWYGTSVVCRDQCLTPEGLTFVRALLPADTEDRRHVAAIWLTTVAAGRE
jgi:hypothetical protein